MLRAPIVTVWLLLRIIMRVRLSVREVAKLRLNA